MSLSTSSSVSTTVRTELGVLLAFISIKLEELPKEDNGGLEAELDEDVSSGTEDEDRGIFGDGTRLGSSGETVLATLELVSGGTFSIEPALEAAADDGRDNDMTRWRAEVGGKGGNKTSAGTGGGTYG